MDAKQTTLRVLMFPWLVHGHISPFLELARKLSERNIYIYFCSTPINLSSIKNRLTDNYSRSIQLVEFHLPSSPELPPHHHTTNGLPPHLLPTLRAAFEMASPTFSTILKTLNPDLVIYDIFQPWLPPMASSHNNTPAVHFKVTGATANSFFLHMYMYRGTAEFPSSVICMREYELRKLYSVVQSPADTIRIRDGSFGYIEQPCSIVLAKSCREIDGKYINYLSDLSKKKVVPVGILCRDPIEEDDNTEILQWLSKKDLSSTVFVAFGSECYLCKEEMEELAHGLELSSVNFIWAVRFPEGEKIGGKIGVDEVFPEGFLDRVRERGMIVEGWAPQAKILGHLSIGGFVSHCGWGSVTESMRYGVPIIGIPMQYDQFVFARLAVEVGVGVEVMRVENGKLKREEVAKAIREVVVEKTGELRKKKAKELSESIRMKADEEILEVVQELTQLCEKYRQLQQ